MNVALIRTEPIIWKFPTAFCNWGPEEREAIERVVSSGRYTMGSDVESFESEFSAWHGMKHAIMVNSGSSANLIAVMALCDNQGFLTASVPALAWATTFSPLIRAGLMDLVINDCDDTWNVRNWRFADFMVACPILGNPAHMEGTTALSYPSTMPLIVDNCESIGARDENGKLCGTHGLLNTFSFYHSHQLSAIEGGCILTNDDALARQCRLLRNHGWTRGLEPTRSFSEEYCFETMGFNVRPLEMHAAIAREQLRKLDSSILLRTLNFSYFAEKTRDLPIKLPKIPEGCRPSFFGIHFCVASSEVRTKLAKAFRAEGIDCRPPVAGSFRKQPYGKPWSDQQTPNADRIHETGIMIGNPPFDGSELIDMAVKVMRGVL